MFDFDPERENCTHSQAFAVFVTPGGIYRSDLKTFQSKHSPTRFPYPFQNLEFRNQWNNTRVHWWYHSTGDETENAQGNSNFTQNIMIRTVAGNASRGRGLPPTSNILPYNENLMRRPGVEVRRESLTRMRNLESAHEIFSLLRDLTQKSEHDLVDQLSIIDDKTLNSLDPEKPYFQSNQFYHDLVEEFSREELAALQNAQENLRYYKEHCDSNFTTPPQSLNPPLAWALHEIAPQLDLRVYEQLNETEKANLLKTVLGPALDFAVNQLQSKAEVAATQQSSFRSIEEIQEKQNDLRNDINQDSNVLINSQLESSLKETEANQAQEISEATEDFLREIAQPIQESSSLEQAN